MSTYLGSIHGALHDFNVLPPNVDIKKEIDNHSTFFMTLALYYLSQEYAATSDQIFGSPATLL